MNKFAILIGNSTFPFDESGKLTELTSPENDVRGLRSVLVDPERGEFPEKNVFVLENKTKQEIEKKIEKIFSNEKKEDLILIYYAGHGFLSTEGKLHLASNDTDCDNSFSTAIQISTIRNIITNKNHRKVILILDCCYSGDAGSELNARGGVLDRELTESGRGIYLLAASGSNFAFETKENGLFTKHLINGIATGEADTGEDGYIDIHELFEYITKCVRAEYPHQVPRKFGFQETGKLYIAKSGRSFKKESNEDIGVLTKEDNEKLEIIKIIEGQARYRPIIPFLGAGISISAGFPTIRFIVQYLAKVDFAIRQGVFKDRFPVIKSGHEKYNDHEAYLENYRQHPSKYLEDFGWPNLGQLNVDIWDWLDRVGREKIFEDNNKISKSEDLNVKIKYPDLLAYDLAEKEKIKELFDCLPTLGRHYRNQPLDFRDHQQAIVQYVLRKEQAGHEIGTAQAILKEWLLWKNHYFNTIDKPKPEPSLLYGDWEMLLDKLCEGNYNLTDTFFTSFENKLIPSLSHRYLSFLQPKLGIQLLLTTNFDSLLERAFYHEGIPIKVFDVHRNAELPDASLVNRQLSLLKLHGSAYGLRFGERLKPPVTDSHNNALAFIPKDALIIVIGFNGSERRIMQMLHAFAQERGCEDKKPKLIWIQGPGEPGPLFNDLLANLKNVNRVNVKHMDTFIQELYFHITNSYQASSVAYSTIPNRPLSSELQPSPPITKDEKENKRRPIQFRIAEIQEGKSSSNWSSLEGMAFVNSLDDKGYTIIWIDFENHHTVEGIIAEIFNRVRMVDPLAPSCAITNMDDDVDVNATSSISKAVERILDVFKRGRYVLVLDLVESFGRPQMVHHGMISSDKKTDEKAFKRSVKNLKLFMSQLLKPVPLNTVKSYWDSYIVITADTPRLRHSPVGKPILKNLPSSYSEMFNLVKSFEKTYKEYDHVHIVSQKPGEGYNLIKEDQYKPYPKPLEQFMPHWYPSNTVLSDSDQEKRSINRTKNALSILEILREKSDSDSDYENIKIKVKKLSLSGVTDGFICILSIFRRPRPVPLIRSFIERWGLHQIGTDNSVDEKNSVISPRAINELLQLLETNVPDKNKNKSPVGVVLQNHEGGIIWLFREFYEATYDALTENIHRQAWLSEIEENTKSLSISAAIMDGSLNITWHLVAARAYYVDVFLATHDIRAFWEYLYHRVSAIRTITLLITIIENAIKKNVSKESNIIWIKLNQHCSNLSSEYQNLPKGEFNDNEQFKWYLWVIGVFDSIKQEQDVKEDFQDLYNDNKLARYFKVLRKNSLKTLLMALNKNKLFLRTCAAPDSVLAWSRQFLASELGYMEKITDISSDSNNSELNIEPTIKDLRELFIRLELQALRSKMNYKKALDHSLPGDSQSKSEQERLEIEKKRFINNIESLGSKTSKDEDFDKYFSEARKNLSNLFNIALCLVEPCDDRAQDFTKFICDSLLKIKTLDPQIEKWKKKELIIAYELRCRAQFKEWTFWQPLLERNLSTHLEPKKKQLLVEAEKLSIRYENLIRETAETNDGDARHRSTTLTIRARALYLRGHFPQAHHFLDLASAGLFSESIDHWSLISIVHIVRAELLAISAHQHYFSLSEHDQVLKELKIKYQIDLKLKLSELPGNYKYFSELTKVLQPVVAASLKKIKRAEQELDHAERLFRNMAHQNIWLIHLEFGWAQLLIEKMLFEMELLFLAWPSLEVTDFLKESRDLEQTILECMKRIRNVFDIIPYQSSPWDEIQIDEMESGRSMFKIECNALKIWRQLYVVGAYYSRLLNFLYGIKDEKGLHVIPYETEVSHVTNNFIFPIFQEGLGDGEDMDEKYLERWKLWCIAMRFDNFGENIKFDCTPKINKSLKSISFRATVIEAMTDEIGPEKIKEMWRIRRN